MSAARVLRLFAFPALSPVVGYLWISRYVIASVEIASGYELTIIAACLVGGVSIAGGVGSVAGAVLGRCSWRSSPTRFP
jgi:ribose/xylose/arabinose/galactoside ABC-type transport system permease subunit